MVRERLNDHESAKPHLAHLAGGAVCCNTGSGARPSVQRACHSATGRPRSLRGGAYPPPKAGYHALAAKDNDLQLHAGLDQRFARRFGESHLGDGDNGLIEGHGVFRLRGIRCNTAYHPHYHAIARRIICGQRDTGQLRGLNIGDVFRVDLRAGQILGLARHNIGTRALSHRQNLHAGRANGALVAPRRVQASGCRSAAP